MVVYGKGLSDVKVFQFVPSRYADGLVYFRWRHVCSRTELEMQDSQRYDVLYVCTVCVYVCNLAICNLARIIIAIINFLSR